MALFSAISITASTKKPWYMKTTIVLLPQSANVLKSGVILITRAPSIAAEGSRASLTNNRYNGVEAQ